MKANLSYLIFLFSVLVSCQSVTTDTFQNPLLETGLNPSCVFYNGIYYYTQGNNSSIQIWETTDITKLNEAKTKQVWAAENPDSMQNIWAPDLQRIGGKWYIYMSAGNSNRANRHIYVLENTAEKPTEGTFMLKGMITLDAGSNWGIEPTSFVHKGKQYLVWAGQEEDALQLGFETKINLYIALMENPWTLASERVLISKPELEWEREWVNEDGTRPAKPYYCNESPAFTYSPDSTQLDIFFNSNSFSTVYHCVGVITAQAEANLLDASSWIKNPEPIFLQNPTDSVLGPGGLCFIPSPDGTESYLLYHARTDKTTQQNAKGQPNSSPRLQKIIWGKDGIPSKEMILGTE